LVSIWNEPWEIISHRRMIIAGEFPAYVGQAS